MKPYLIAIIIIAVLVVLNVVFDGQVVYMIAPLWGGR